MTEAGGQSEWDVDRKSGVRHRPPAVIGPVAMIAHGIFPPDKMQPARVRALLAEAALQGVDLCFLRSDECDPETGMVRAQRWDEGGWQESHLPLPPIVLIITDPETADDVRIDQWIRASALALGAGKRDKQAVTDLLAGTEWKRYAVPSERLEPGRFDRQLASWLDGGGIVVKPNDGMRGMGVHFVIPAGGGRWEVIKDGQHRVVGADEAIDQLTRSIAGRLSYRSYLVQRYIDTSDRSGRPGTVRVELVRQPGGAWGVVRVTGRISAPGKIISTISRGASLMTGEGYLAARGETDIPGRLQELEAFSVGVANLLTACDAAHYYEWGLDLMMDPERRFWFLEANTRPLNFGGEFERATHVIAYLKSLCRSLER